MSISYGTYFTSPLDIRALSEGLELRFGTTFHVEDEGDYVRCTAAEGPLWIACWAPHGMEDDKGIPFESFDTVIDVSASGEFDDAAATLGRKIFSWVTSTYDSHAILVRNVQELVHADAGAGIS